MASLTISGILYVEHVLRRLSDLGREDFVGRELFEMPTTLHGLYELMLKECGKSRTDEEIFTLRCLFAWLAFSREGLTLQNAWDIVESASRSTTNKLDLESEIVGRSSRYVFLDSSVHWR
jgi:hypothetical protein